MRKICIIVLTFLLIGNGNFLLGHGFLQSTRLTGFTIGSDLLKNSRNYVVSPDINFTYFLLNIGASSQFAKESNPSYNLYLGIGLINFFQVQLGTNFSDKRLKIRTILPVLSKSPFTWDYVEHLCELEWYERINLQLHYEKNYNDSKLNNFGIGLSYLIL